MKAGIRTGLVWYGNNLRVHDNASLSRAISEQDRVIAVYFFDPRHYIPDFYGFIKTQKFRAQFLIETVDALRSNLALRNISLLIYHDKPEHVMHVLCEKYQIHRIYYQPEWTANEVETLERTQAHTRDFSPQWIPCKDQFLLHPDDLQTTNITQIFSSLKSVHINRSLVRSPISIPSLLPENKIEHHSKLPTLDSLGLKHLKHDFQADFQFEGGENKARTRLKDYYWEGLIDQNSHSKLSPWLANGSLSARLVYTELQRYEENFGATRTSKELLKELLWRDFYKHRFRLHEHFANQLNSDTALCNLNENQRSTLELWIEGMTTEPLVNVPMKMLKTTGWIDHHSRQIVARYLIKAIPNYWTIGAAYFQSILIDADPSSNLGNWKHLWNSRSDDFKNTIYP